MSQSLGNESPAASADTNHELRRLAARFDELSGGFTREAERKLELARAMADEEGVRREHIKIQVMRAARKMFAGSYRELTGERGLEVDA